MENKNIFLIGLGVLLISFFLYTYITDFNLSSLATDSGFDTDYGGSSSSSSSDWGSSSSDGSGGDGDVFGFWENIMFGTFGMFMIWCVKAKSKTKQIIATIIVSILTITRLLVFLFVITMLLGMMILVPISLFQNRKKSKKVQKKKLTLNVKNEDKPLLEEGYQIFYDVQMAWMNFDYDKLRELVTDELYNMYYNQLQTLNVKGQKNIMSDFDLIGYDLVSQRTNKDGSKTIKMELNVKFYDYIVDQNGKKVRGFSIKKVDMTYMLTFVYNESAISTCPSCNAPLEAGKTICEYCNTHIHSTRSKMKLSNKKVLYQR